MRENKTSRRIKRANRRKKHWDDRLFEIVMYTVLIVFIALIIYPIWFVLIASVSNAEAVTAGQVVFLPKGFDLGGYKRVFQNTDIWIGYANTIFYTFFGSLCSVLSTVMAGYAVSRKDLKGRTLFVIFLMIPMYFSGGLIANYLNMKQLGLLDTRLAMVIRGLVAASNVIVVRTYINNSIPYELQEAAFVDGASDFYTFKNVILPLSKPILAYLSINAAVTRWNEYMNALIYLKTEALYPLQIFLRRILLQGQMASTMYDEGNAESVISMIAEASVANQMKYALIIIASVPLLAIYPFLEKYFSKGITMGGVKG